MGKFFNGFGGTWLIAAVVGLVGQGLFAWADLGVNAAILSVLVVAAVWFSIRSERAKGERRVWLWAVPVVLGGVGLALMDAPFLQALNVAMVLAGSGMMVLAANSRHGEGALLQSFAAATGWILVFIEGVCELLKPSTGERFRLTEKRKAQLAALVRGGLIAGPLVLVFGILLASADPVFGKVITPNWDLDFSGLYMRTMLFLGFGVFAAGMLKGMRGGSEVCTLGDGYEAPKTVGTTEFAVVFGSLSVMFGLFVAIQGRYLFGGNDVVLASEGLTYAVYARRGFFELVTVAALAIPTVLGFLSVAKRDRESQSGWTKALSVTFLSLVGLMLVSAALRMGLYVDVYGLTELRFYTIAAMGWLGAAIVCLVYLVAVSREGSSGTWLVGTAMVSVFLTTLSNPDRTIASVNLSRPSETVSVDTEYLMSLGSGAVEPLWTAYADDRTHKGRRIRSELTSRHLDNGDWRGWTWSKARAREAVSRK